MQTKASAHTQVPPRQPERYNGCVMTVAPGVSSLAGYGSGHSNTEHAPTAFFLKPPAHTHALT